MDRLVAIGEAAKILGVSITTLRRWGKEGKLLSEPSTSTHRRYKLSNLQMQTKTLVPTDDTRKIIAYARVSSHDQKSDLERQKQVIEKIEKLLSKIKSVIEDFENDTDA